jgi:hypothetical protein
LQNAGIGDGSYAGSAALAAGGAYHLALNAADSNSLLLSTGFKLSFDGMSRSNAGFELGFGNKYFLRAGYARDIQGPTVEWQRGLSVGGGIKINQVRIDYAYRSEGNLGYVHTVGLTAFFEASPVTKESAAQDVPTQGSSEGQAGAAPLNSNTVTNLPTASEVTRTPSTFSKAADAAPSSDDKKPVMLKFKIDSQDDLPAPKLFELAEGKLKLGLRKEALELYSKAVQKDPGLKKAWGRLGEIYKQESVDSYERLLELDPQNKAAREWLDRLSK